VNFVSTFLLYAQELSNLYCLLQNTNWNKVPKTELFGVLNFVSSCTSFCASWVRPYGQGKLAVASQKPMGRPCGQWFCFFCGMPIQSGDNSAKTHRQVYQVLESRRGSLLHHTACCRGVKTEGTYDEVVKDQPNYVAPRSPNILLHVSNMNAHIYAWKSETSRAHTRARTHAHARTRTRTHTHRANGDVDETGWHVKIDILC